MPGDPTRASGEGQLIKIALSDVAMAMVGNLPGAQQPHQQRRRPAKARRSRG